MKKCFSEKQTMLMKSSIFYHSFLQLISGEFSLSSNSGKRFFPLISFKISNNSSDGIFLFLFRHYSWGSNIPHDQLTFSSLLVSIRTTSIALTNSTFCPHSIYMFWVDLRTNNYFCHLHHKMIGFYNRDERGLLRGTNWVFK